MLVGGMKNPLPGMNPWRALWKIDLIRSWTLLDREGLLRLPSKRISEGNSDREEAAASYFTSKFIETVRFVTRRSTFSKRSTSNAFPMLFPARSSMVVWTAM